MLEGLLGKVMAGWMSLSALMFSSYTGNEPVFRPLQCRIGQNYLMVNAKLDNAFDNDFSDVFKCGKPVILNFKIEIHNGNRTEHTSTYRHTVTYDPMNATWEIIKSETNQKDVISTYQKLLEEISELECSISRDVKWRSVEIRAEAWLQPLQLTNPDRNIDLMVLWKFKRPSVRNTLNLPPVS